MNLTFLNTFLMTNVLILLLAVDKRYRTWLYSSTIIITFANKNFLLSSSLYKKL